MTPRKLSTAFAIFLSLSLCLTVAAGTRYPDSPKKPVTDAYHSTKVTDPYQWLEDPNAAEVKNWSREQNQLSRSYFDALPYRNGLEQHLTQIRGEESARVYGLTEEGGRIFALRFKPPAQQPVLVRLHSLFPPALWTPVFDPNQYDTNGTTSIDWYVPSPDGKLIAICLSHGGSEQGTLHFFEADTGRKLADEIPRVQYPTGGGSAAWTSDGRTILYTRYPHAGERPEVDLNFFQQVWRHQLGAPAQEDRLEIGKEFPRIAEIELETSESGGWILATVANGDGGDFAHYLRDPQGKWQQISRFEEGVKVGKFGRNQDLFLLTLNKAPRGKLLRVPLSAPVLEKAQTVVPEQKGVIQEFEPCESGLYVSFLVGGPCSG